MGNRARGSSGEPNAGVTQHNDGDPLGEEVLDEVTKEHRERPISGRSWWFARRLTSKALGSRELGLLATLVLLLAVFATRHPAFLSIGNMTTIGRNVSEVGIIAIGMTIVLIVGEVDLSVGALYGLAGVVAGIITIETGNPVLAILIALAVGAAVGAVNGVLVAYFGLNSFMVTLAMLNVVFGIALILTGGIIVDLGSVPFEPERVQLIYTLGSGNFFSLDSQLIFYILLTLFGIILLRKTLMGYRLFSVGSNQEAARLSGISVGRTKVIAFVMSGALSAWVGVLALGFVGSMNPQAGLGLEFDVFAAAIIGGASLLGGRGSLVGTLLGTLILGVVANGLILSGVQSTYQVLVVGIVILLAIGLDRLREARGLRA